MPKKTPNLFSYQKEILDILTHRTCPKCNRRLELNADNFEIELSVTITNRGFSWHCRKCLKEIR